jgi:hypothetical protein
MLPPPDQMGFVTDDLERTARELGRLWEIESWAVHEYSGEVLAHRWFRGEPGTFASRNAVAPGGRIGIVQPLAGPSVHLEALDRCGPGAAYLTWFVTDLGRVEERMARLGVEEVMRGGGHGLDADGEFVYFDTVATLGLYTQYTVAPRRRRPPSGTIG